MEIPLALLVDYANISREGKLNILGIFDTLWVISFPATHPQMQLVINFEASRAEEGKEKKVEVQFRDSDGNKLNSISGKLKVPKGESGQPIKMTHIIVINNLLIEKPGHYEFNILVNDDSKKPVPLNVVLKSENLRK